MKKVFALFLCLVMVLSLAACGTKAPAATDPKSPVKDNSAGTEGSSSEQPNVPALKGPGNVTLKRLGYNVAFDPNTDINAQVLEESTGYHAEYYMLPAENADEKLLMDISGGADYDVVSTTVNQWRTLVAQGALQPLDDLLEVYGQDVLAGNSETVWNAVRARTATSTAFPICTPIPRKSPCS